MFPVHHQPQDPTQARNVIWQGFLEWDEKFRSPNNPQNKSYFPFQISTNLKDVEPDLRTDSWPYTLIIKLVPKQLIGNIAGIYLKHSKSVLLHAVQCEDLEYLNIALSSGFAGCVHFPSTTPACDIKVLILLYTPEKRTYHGFIPNDQKGIVDCLHYITRESLSSHEVFRQRLEMGLIHQQYPHQLPLYERQIIWQGVLEWRDEIRNSNDPQKIARDVPCQVVTYYKDVEPDLKADSWPQKLILQLMPNQLIHSVCGLYQKNAKFVLFHPLNCEALESLTETMKSGFTGCVHFTSGSSACNIRALLLMYRAEKHIYYGFIPKDQKTFADHLCLLIQQSESSQPLISQEQVTNKVADLSTNINDLPNEMLVNIFSYISVEDIGLNLQFVCTRWFELCLDDVLWKNSTYNTQSSDHNEQYILTLLEKIPKLQCFETEKSTDAILHKLVNFCKNLLKLQINRHRECCNKEAFRECCNKEIFRKVLSEYTKLELLTVPGRVLVNEQLTKLVGKMANLHTLSVASSRGPENERIILKHIAYGCPSLRHLDICNVRWLYSDLKHFLEQKENKLYSFSVSAVSQDGLCVFPLLALCRLSLQKLHLGELPYNTDFSTFSTIRTLSNLKSLSMTSDFYHVESVIADLFADSALSQLLEFEMCHCDAVGEILVQSICNNCPNLLKLVLCGSMYLHNEGLKFLHKCENLQELDVTGCPQLTGDCLDYIRRCTKLKAVFR